jgi:orotate phosphoribosyltransferase
MTRVDTERARLAADVADAALLRGEFVLSSGRRSSYYLDKYRFETDPALLRRIAHGLADLLDGPVDRLAGPELGAVALVTAVSLETGIPFVIVRRAAKEYGGSRHIEGVLEPGETVAVIEDVITTGSQALAAAELVTAAGASVVAILAVVDRDEGGSDAIRAAGYPFRPLLTRADLGMNVEADA